MTGGVPSFAPPLDQPSARTFWERLQADTLSLPKCSACGRWQWYPLETGPCCIGATYEWTDLPGTGSVFTFTTIHYPFLPLGAPQTPFSVGLLLLDGTEGIRFVGLLDTPHPSIGSRVRMTTIASDGRRIPVFVPELDPNPDGEVLGSTEGCPQ
jgi:uncharacterized OB-fold protein